MTLGTTSRNPRLVGPQTRRHEALANQVHIGPYDELDLPAVMRMIQQDPEWRIVDCNNRVRFQGAEAVLSWLQSKGGGGWQERWQKGDGDQLGWMTDVTAEHMVPRSTVTVGMSSLILARVILPGYSLFTPFPSRHLTPLTIQLRGAETFRATEQAAQQIGLTHDQYTRARGVLIRIVLHTGRDPDQLVADDFLEYRASMFTRTDRAPTGVHAAWELLRRIGVLSADADLRQLLRRGRKSTEEFVDSYEVRSSTIRDVFVRYLSEKRSALDYATFRGLTSMLVGQFWTDIEAHHPGIDSLRLPRAVVTAWKERLSTVVDGSGQQRTRRNRFEVLGRVRTFYLDIAQWAIEDPSWVPWVVPSPISKNELAGKKRRRQLTAARTHQRIRERLPLLPDLVAVAEEHRTCTGELLSLAAETTVGGEFDHDRRRYRRLPVINSVQSSKTGRGHVLVEDVTTGQRQNLTVAEEEGFWAWAVIETLRHTGLRIEELLELTHLALVSYTLPKTGELVPLLQVVPSKSNEERLLLVSPELASTLATIITRLRRLNAGVVPLVARYDSLEAMAGPPLPHLFQRKQGIRTAVISFGYARKVISQTIQRADLRDAAGRPLRYTPHDFRRMFATEAVGSGLPVHIAAKVLGHHSINTTQSYVAVFQDELIQAYRSFLDHRRALRPTTEYREPTEQEWQEFQQHFELRKVALGTCARPYGTPCRHEHAPLTELTTTGIDPVGADGQ